ncbi:hypothetical protein A2311_02795 [candidate division WOR-1 bacterium RIFOXYB2_FULL_48_7]|uniref:RecF/RecN/SMC N-terminal domain-containing protein n=1 Tax=candidate division WOR-1 bacterium RIFOXYB2_FULL_48_7 TaxID=1802583 RepID=A0A1F4TME0_UNCSA|nr:MAG: hypothetical protein A2311_02795 [candidate division WOR-1 bacterium RIFOXYB2_FULL_48_7]
MFLKSLSLRGFKTFADSTDIEFNPEARITAVVGPNGCGKSNVLDATRWVLGEDNTRFLRVGALENIIFAGTSQKKPLSLAEVVITFDNSTGRLPVPYSEVAIKRRTFRGGESEFFINKNACRLKDIKDLLMDTGLGEGTYAIITQGQVDAILSSKGEDRRVVFEEAAGINKYKTRKTSAEKKLIAAEQNILRINDLRTEVGEHIVVLEEQAKKAAAYLEIQAQVKELEIGLSKKLIAALLEKKGKLETDLALARQASVEKQSRAKEIEAELQAQREHLRQHELTIEEELVKLDNEKDRLRDLELNRRFVEGELKREKGILAGLAAKKQALVEKIEALKNPHHSSSQQPGTSLINSEAMDEIINGTRSLVNLLADILTNIESDETVALLEAKDQLATHALEIELLSAELLRTEQEVEKSNFSLHAHQLELEKYASSSENPEAKTSLLGKINGLKTERDKLRASILELEDKLREEEKNERAVGTNTAVLEVGIAKVEGEITAISDRLNLEYNLSLPEIESLPYVVSNTGKAKNEIEDGKARLRALEPVNLLAIEEFNKAKERLSFIEVQLTDLTSARDNLRNLIIELDQKAEENFLQTMAQISTIFSEVFAKLFNGGEAKIALAEGQPPLEAEIEISVRPNGRRWTALSLLSGGERSLCAIAILFSLMKIRPSPFCFLDEVDAALDEANIGRFAGMLKDFSSTTQIIVISHNKRTMAAADTIYGVTMQEPGVSSVISVKLTEAAL